MNWRIVVVDRVRARPAALASVLTHQTVGPQTLAVVSGLPTHIAHRQVEARLARGASLLVETSGRPADGMVLLSSLAVDVVRALPLALATPRGRRRRGGVVAEVAPDGRGETARRLFVGVDLTPEEWATHEMELRQRVDALGFDPTARTYVAAVDGRLASFRDFVPPTGPDRRTSKPTWVDATLRAGPTTGRLVAFDLT